MKPFASNQIPVHVPGEHRLVIETVSLQVDVSAGNHVGASLTYQHDDVPIQVFVPLSLSYRLPSNYDVYHALHGVRIYPDPDSIVQLQLYSPDGTTGTPFLTVSGSLIDM